MFHTFISDLGDSIAINLRTIAAVISTKGASQDSFYQCGIVVGAHIFYVQQSYKDVLALAVSAAQIPPHLDSSTNSDSPASIEEFYASGRR